MPDKQQSPSVTELCERLECVENIATRLSRLERRAMLHREDASEACMSWDTARSLYGKGLTARYARFLRLTVLGKQVRAALNASPKDSPDAP
jgi:hypothetical protein